MRVKRYIGDTIGDTMNRIKRELGPEAVILQTRQIKEGGIFGLFARTKVEITAAIEEKPADSLYRSGEQTDRPVNREVIQKAYEAYREKENAFARERYFPDPLPEDTKSEIKQMHNILKEIKGQIAKIEESQEKLPPSAEKWLNFLVERGISEKTGREIINLVTGDLQGEALEDSEMVFAKLQSQIMKFCAHTDPIKTRKNATLVVALVGPTGVGKTTTIGKLAAGFSIIDKKRVALVTADTYRVAAVEQLRTFGEIIGVPVEVVMTPEGLKEAIVRHQDKELIFIDTAGRSPHHELHMSELEAFMNAAQPDLTMLVLSVTTSLPDQVMVYERFKKLSSHLILTKLDESRSPGTILDIMARTKLPVAYLTNGQNVPDDIEAATPQKLVKCILGEGNPCE